MAITLNRLKNQSPVESIDAWEQGGNLSKEWIGQDRSSFFLPTACFVRDEAAHFDPQGVGQALERTNRRPCPAVLDLGDVGAGNLHAARELALAQVPSAPNPKQLIGHPTRMALCQILGENWLVSPKGLVASSAERICCSKLHQIAAGVAATHCFPRFHSRKRCGHDVVRSARADSPRCRFRTVWNLNFAKN